MHAPREKAQSHPRAGTSPHPAERNSEATVQFLQTIPAIYAFAKDTGRTSPLANPNELSHPVLSRISGPVQTSNLTHLKLGPIPYSSRLAVNQVDQSYLTACFRGETRKGPTAPPAGYCSKALCAPAPPSPREVVRHPDQEARAPRS